MTPEARPCPGRARRGGAFLLLALAPLVGGCVYLNTLYNARATFDEAERARRAGRADAAATSYEAAAAGAASAFRRDPEGRWADDSLLLLGLASFRTGQFARALPALEEARTHAAAADDGEVARTATLYLGATRAQLGDHEGALALLNEAMLGLEGGALLAEGHFWRGQLQLVRGAFDQGLWDLARAVEADPTLRAPAALARLEAGLMRGDTVVARRAIDVLFDGPAGAALADSLAAVVEGVARTDGPARGAALLAGAREAAWSPEPRDRLVLLRAQLRHQAGDSAGAVDDAGWIADGSGPIGADSRLQLARWQLGQAASLDALAGVRAILLPSGGEPAVSELAASIRRVELLAEWSQFDEPLALFAAGEIARDELGAPRLARTLFVGHATRYPGDPWAGKALLAALVVAPDPADDEPLRRGLESRTSDPYVATARTGTVGADRVSRLEGELAVRLAALRERLEPEVRRRDLFLRGADTLRMRVP